MNLAEKRAAYNAALKAAQDAAAAIEQAGTDSDLETLERAFEESNTALVEARSALEKAEKVAEVRETSPVPVPAEPAAVEERSSLRVEVGREEPVYRPDVQLSYFRDLALAGRDQDAAERLRRHAVVEARADNTTASTDGGGFVPPTYLQNLYSPLARAGRPFANRIPKIALPSTGNTISMPKVTTGVSVATQVNELDALSSTAVVEEVDTYTIRTIGGYLDWSLQLLERSEPSFDAVIMSDLVNAYDVQLDTQLIDGATASSEHLGIREVSGVISVTYSDASPTAAELLPKIYDASQQIYTNRHMPADLVLMHPRRAAWLASGLSSTFPLFQQGGLNQAAGSQDNTFVNMMAGLEVLLDTNIATNYSQSGGTNEDEIYVLHSGDMYLAEGPFRTEAFMSPLSEKLGVRFRGFAYSCFISERYAKSIAIVKGGGLVAPSF